MSMAQTRLPQTPRLGKFGRLKNIEEELSSLSPPNSSATSANHGLCVELKPTGSQVASFQSQGATTSLIACSSCSKHVFLNRIPYILLKTSISYNPETNLSNKPKVEVYFSVFTDQQLYHGIAALLLRHSDGVREIQRHLLLRMLQRRRVVGASTSTFGAEIRKVEVRKGKKDEKRRLQISSKHFKIRSTSCCAEKPLACIQCSC